MNRRLHVFVIGLLITISVFSNDPIIIKGIVKDKQTDEFIPFAHVVIGSTVSITNINGEFAIPIEDIPDEPLELSISYIGYQTFSKVIGNYDEYQVLYIEPSLTKLEEVTVRTGPAIMGKVFNNFHLNYIMEPQHMVGYYNESMSDSLNKYYQGEGILDIYTPSNVNPFGSPVVIPQRARKKVYRPFPTENILAGNASDMAHSSIWRSDSFLNTKQRANYYYYYDGEEKMGAHSVLLVDFEPKNKKGDTSGTLFIDDITYAILKIEYTPIIKRSKFWNHVDWTEEYELIDGAFKLVSVIFSGKAQDNTLLYKAALVIDKAAIVYEAPWSENLMGIHDSFLDGIVDEDDESFWSGYHSVKSNERIAELISHQKNNY